MADNGGTDWFRELRRAVGAPLFWIGSAMAAVSLISALSRLFEVGLVGVFGDFVRFYRAMLSPLHDWINLLPFPFEIPPLAVEAMVVYAALVLMGYRSTTIDLIPFEVLEPKTNKDAGIIFSEFRDLSFQGKVMKGLRCLLLLPVLRLEPVTAYFTKLPAEDRLITSSVDAEEILREARTVLRQNMLAFIGVPAVVIIFFLLNAYAPGL